MFISTNSLAVLPEFPYQITVRQQLSTMVDGKTSRSMKLIRKWLNTIAQLSSLPVSGLQRISPMLRMLEVSGSDEHSVNNTRVL